MDSRPSRGALLVLVGLLFATVAVTAAVTDPEVARVPAPPMDPGGDGPTRERDEPDEVAEPTTAEAPDVESGVDGVLGPDLGWLAGLGLLVLLAVGLALMWRTMRDRRVTLRATAVTRAAERARRREQVREAVAAGLDQLIADDGDPRAAVIGCWLRLERAAAAAGVRRDPADVPADLVARLLAGHEVSGAVLERFAAVYREARYAPHEIGGTMRDEAIAALQRLHAELSSGLSSGLPSELPSGLSSRLSAGGKVPG